MARKSSICLDELTDSAFYILLSVLEPRHGYLIMKYIQEITDNKVIMGPASIYSTLKKLLSAELIDLELKDNLKIYKITSKGYDLLIKEVNRKKEMIRLANYCLNKEGKII